MRPQQFLMEGIHFSVIFLMFLWRALHFEALPKFLPDRPWRIGIRHPRKNQLIASIETRGEESIFTSGDYERSFMYNGKRYHHILDPRTGYPAQGTQSVTVIHTDSGLADAAATALFIAGPEDWIKIAKKLKLTQVMLIDDKGVIHITPEMKNRLKFEFPNEATLIVTAPL